MTKLKSKKANKIFDETKDLDSIDIDNITIEKIDEEINDFYIDKEKIDNIKAPDDMKFWVKEAIDKAEYDMKEEKKRKSKISVAASIAVILSVGVYNPVLAHALPPVENILEIVNNILKIDEIASTTGIDKLIPKAILDENGKIKFKVVSKYNIENLPKEWQNKSENIEYESELEELEKENQDWEDEETEEKYIDVYEENVYIPSNQEETESLIHGMANGLIHAIDNIKRGYTEITPKTIDIAIDSLKNLQNQEDRDYLYTLLEEWKTGNFDNAVEVHNYVWNMQNGDIGEAGSLDYEEIEKIKNNHFN